MNFVLEMLENDIKPTAGEYFQELVRAKRDDEELFNKLTNYYPLFKEKEPYISILQGSYFERKDS